LILKRVFLEQLLPFFRFSKRLWVGWISSEAKSYLWHQDGTPAPRGWVGLFEAGDWWEFKDRAAKRATFRRSPAAREVEAFVAVVDGELWRIERERKLMRGEIDAWRFTVRSDGEEEECFGVFSIPPERWDLDPRDVTERTPT